MLGSLWFMLLALTVQDTKTEAVDDCPSGWYQNQGQCYNFVTTQLATQQRATFYCQQFHASLISIDTADEHVFVQKWLTSYDTGRHPWLTSGYRDLTGRMFWESDESPIKTDFFPDDASRERTYEDAATGSEYNVIAYKFSDSLNEYRWRWMRLVEPGYFVCEMSKVNTWKMYQQARDFSYGTGISDVSLLQMAPNITYQSRDVVFFEYGTGTTTVVLDCVASGNPSPEYRWYRGSDSSNMKTEITPDVSTRYAISNGRLTITNPDQKLDSGIYTCKVSNPLGTALSNPIQVSYGYVGQFSNVQPSIIDAVMYMGIEITCQPPAHNTELSYTWYKTDMIFIKPEFNAQYFLSRNGRLYISEVQPADQAEYFCIVFMTPGNGKDMTLSQAPSRTSLGIPLKVKGGNANTYGPDIQDRFPQYFPLVPMEGDEVQIECLAYGRLPLYYSWVREDGPLHPRAYTKDYNRVLVLPSARIEDTGSYTCIVKSDSGRANKTVYLGLKARPSFPYPLLNQHADEGRPLTWTCNALGVPKPTYKWYKDGDVITSGSLDGVKVTRNILNFEKVEAKKHNGVYQCEATNIHGTARSSAQLRALSLAPTFWASPVEASKQAALGGNVTIPCLPQAAPRATIKWVKNGAEVGRVLPSGALELTALTQADAGIYTCVATNDLGEAESSCLLMIQGEMVLVETPTDLVIEVNATGVLPCRASYDVNKMDVTYSWMFFSHVIDFSPEGQGRDKAHYAMPFSLNQESGMLYIMAAQFRHAGLYTCVVTTTTGSITASAYVTVNGPPGEPMGVHVKPIDKTLGQLADNIALWWHDGEVRGYPVTKYSIEYLSQYDQEWKILKEGVSVQDTNIEAYPTWRKFDIKEGLSPGTGYNFRVSAGNDQTGYGEPSTGPYQSYYIVSAPPIEAPTNVGGGGGSVGQLIITWNPLPRSAWGGPNVRYIPYYRRQTEGGSSRKWETPVEIQDTYLHVVVGVEFYYTPYEVKVQAVNDKGRGPNSTVAIVYSAEDMPNLTPTSISFEVINGTAATVSWEPVPNTREAARGTVFAYQVNYWEEPTTLCLGINEHQALFNRFYGDASTGLLIGMEPEGHYCFNIQFINHAGMGPKTDNYNFNLNLRAPGYYPEFVTVSSHGNESVRLTWRGVVVHLGEETIIGYKAWWWNVREDIRTARIAIFDRSGTGVLHGVEPNVIYSVRVLGYSIGGDGKKSPDVYFTLEGQIPYDPLTTNILNSARTLHLRTLPCLVSVVVSITLSQWR
ncbi:contactin-like [Physella acuta]|uniref:contactin-like n=1 Tax=Physella acuta TaxID=109671 RepID=UPI0027DB3133|nr:contactin-like [Physella acuta]